MKRVTSAEWYTYKGNKRTRFDDSDDDSSYHNIVQWFVDHPDLAKKAKKKFNVDDLCEVTGEDLEEFLCYNADESSFKAYCEHFGIDPAWICGYDPYLDEDE